MSTTNTQTHIPQTRDRSRGLEARTLEGRVSLSHSSSRLKATHVASKRLEYHRYAPCTRSGIPTDTWKHLVLFSPIRIRPSKALRARSTRTLNRHDVAVSESKLRTRPVYRYCRHALMNEPFVSPRDPAVGPKPRERSSVMREPRNNILIRTQVRGIPRSRRITRRRRFTRLLRRVRRSRVLSARVYRLTRKMQIKGI